MARGQRSISVPVPVGFAGGDCQMCPGHGIVLTVEIYFVNETARDQG